MAISLRKQKYAVCGMSKVGWKDVSQNISEVAAAPVPNRERTGMHHHRYRSLLESPGVRGGAVDDSAHALKLNPS